jgi:hypothetical protein
VDNIVQHVSRPTAGGHRRMVLSRVAGVVAGLSVLLAAAPSVRAQDATGILTDKIFQGDGVIDILKDVSSGSLEQYFDANGQLLLGIDVNEASSGNESAASQGIAIESLELVITTTDGDFTFSDFYTSTTATLLAQGSTVANEYYTVFGTAGSSSINGGTSSFDLSSFDDVIYLSNISFTGQILGAKLYVSFLDTAKTGANTNESFFDYSNGFEDFAILSASQADALEAASLGVSDAPSSVSYTSLEIPAASAPGAPTPPLSLLLGLGALALWKVRRS